MHLKYEDENKKIYTQSKPDSEHIFFKLYPGIEIMLCSFDFQLQWGGKTYQLPDYFQVSYSYNGIVQMELEKDRLSFIDPGDIYVIQNVKKTYHGKVTTPNYRGFNLLITPEFIPEPNQFIFKSQFDLDMEQLYKKICRNPTFFQLKLFDQAIHICEELFDSLIKEEIGLIRLKTIEFLMLLSKTDFNQFHVRQTFSSKNIKKTEAIKEYMDNHLEDYITIEKLCIQFEITPTLFKNCFRELFYHPPYEYLLKVRLAKAAELLEYTNKSIVTIAKEIGYKNSSNFTRSFKNMYKITPSQYRELEIK